MIQTERLEIIDTGIYLKDPKYSIFVGRIECYRPIGDKQEIGCVIKTKHRGNGYATEALKAVSEVVIESNRIPFLQIAKDNEKSQAVAKRANFVNMHCDQYFPCGLATDIKTRKLFIANNNESNIK